MPILQSDIDRAKALVRESVDLLLVERPTNNLAVDKLTTVLRILDDGKRPGEG